MNNYIIVHEINLLPIWIKIVIVNWFKCMEFKFIPACVWMGYDLGDGRTVVYQVGWFVVAITRIGGCWFMLSKLSKGLSKGLSKRAVKRVVKRAVKKGCQKGFQKGLSKRAFKKGFQKGLSKRAVKKGCQKGLSKRVSCYNS